MRLIADTLSLIRGGKPVLRDISVELEPGQITAIVGPNGAGKSSLLMTLAGLLDPAAGKVLLGTEPLDVIHPLQRARSIGYLPQSGEAAWDVAVEALVALGRMPHRDARQEPVDRAIAALDLDQLRRRPVSTLSGGERARVLLARVLAGEPGWILADEPLAALDLAHQLRLARHLRACAQNGTGIVIVLHDLALAMNHADRVVVLDKGALAANSAPSEALSPEVIERVWGVKAKWLTQPDQNAAAQKIMGQQALVTSSRD